MARWCSGSRELSEEQNKNSLTSNSPKLNRSLRIRRAELTSSQPIEVIGGQTLRADDGLALSSRNNYLSPTERQEAVQLSLALRALARDALRSGAARRVFSSFIEASRG